MTLSTLPWISVESRQLFHLMFSLTGDDNYFKKLEIISWKLCLHYIMNSEVHSVWWTLIDYVPLTLFYSYLVIIPAIFVSNHNATTAKKNYLIFRWHCRLKYLYVRKNLLCHYQDTSYFISRTRMYLHIISAGALPNNLLTACWPHSFLLIFIVNWLDDWILFILQWLIR